MKMKLTQLCVLENYVKTSLVILGHAVGPKGFNIKQVDIDNSATGREAYTGSMLETRDIEHIGDKIHAMPYWNQIDRAEIDDYPATYTCYLRNPKGASEWPWPQERTDGNWSYITKVDWEANLQTYVRSTPVELPKPSVESWTHCEQLADTKALGNASRALVNLPLIYAERRETLQYIAEKARFVSKGANALQKRSLAEFRKTKPRNRAEVARRISNEHLGFVFGVLPLIEDVNGMVEFLGKDQLDFIRSRGLQTVIESRKVAWPPVEGKPDFWNSASAEGKKFFTAYSLEHITTMYSVRTALRYKLTTQLVGQAYDLGADPVATGFDLIPLSFISGWVSNLDYWIRSLSPMVGLEFETGSRNRRTVMSTWTECDVNKTVGTVGLNHKVYRNASVLRNHRFVLTKEPERSLEWDVEFGWYEAAAAASLLIQRYLKPLKRNIALKQFRYKGLRPKWLPEIRYTGRT